jgi:hypothetical protein
MRRIGILAAFLSLLVAAPAAAAPDPTVPAARDTTPVVLSGEQLGDWAVPANQTVQPPLMDVLDPDEDPHNHYSDPLLDSGDALGQGTPVDRLLAFRWHPQAGRFVEVPLQVDEQFTRYLDNSASGFALYSGQDQHTTYAYDREGFRWDGEDPADPCQARPTSDVAKDPVPGLDHNDELAFMAADAGPAAPAGAPTPPGIAELKRVTVGDVGFVYLARSSGKRRPGFDATNGYVRYERDASADVYAFSQSTYDDYGNAKVGTYCDENGTPIGEGRRRPRDTATVATDRYRFRYDGRWLMTRIEISGDRGQTYGPDLVDRFKARAFAQDPESETPCCGYEEEDTNWGGSSVLLGEKVGPVRAIRETWGADSGTNVIRRETFYREEMRQKTWLRVHVIPPLDGIYAQWDFNAGRVTQFHNSRGSHPVDGHNDEAYGNFDDPCNPNFDGNDTSAFDQGYRTLYEQLQLCSAPYHQSVDLADLTFGDPNAGTDWSMVSGPHGSIVDRLTVEVQDQTAGGTAQSVAAVPYYRDDACFDDGTGDDPGPNVSERDDPEPRTRADGTPRECWTPEAGLPDGSDRFFQGSIATHGVHLLFLAESDNARLTVPVDEIVNEWQMVMLDGERPASDGERYGRAFEKPLITTVDG